MKKNKRVLSALLIFALFILSLAGCSNEKGDSETPAEGSGQAAEFSYSDGIDANGHWEGITALDHVELFDYDAIPIPSSTHQIPDERIESEVNYILSTYSVEEQVTDRAVEDGDTVNIDYVGSVDGVEFEGGTTRGAGTVVTIGVTSYIDDFLEQLIGHMPGETMNVEVTFPEGYTNEDLSGKDAVFVTTINYIVESSTPELTNDFVNENLSANYGWTTIEEMNEGIHSNLQKDAIFMYIQEYLVNNTTVSSVPDELLASLERPIIDYYQQGADQYELELDEFLSTYEGVASMEEMLELYRDRNMEQAQYYLVIQAVAEDAGIAVSDGDVQEHFSEYVGVDDYSEYEENYGMPYIKQVVLNQLVMDYLADHAVLEQ